MANKNRADVVDGNFLRRVGQGDLPARTSNTSIAAARLTHSKLLQLFNSQITSRHLDIRARILRQTLDSYYTIGSAGHEGNAAVAEALRPSDMAFLHYRSGAFFVQRAAQVPGQTPIWDLALSFVASADDPISEGRHKVIGSVPLMIPPQTSTIASHLPKAVGAALAIPRGKHLGVETRSPADGIVMCSFGDASANHATALSALNTAAWCSYQQVPLPLLFVCEDNGIGISVPTPDGWIARNFSQRPGLKYFAGDGLHLADAYRAASEAAEYVRRTKKPAFLHLRTVRLLGHAGSDVETVYRSQEQIDATEAQDPLLHSARLILEQGILSGKDLVDLYERMRAQVAAVALEATKRPKLETSEEIMRSILPGPKCHNEPRPNLTQQQAADLYGRRASLMEQPQHLARHLNWALYEMMERYPNTVVFGEDVAKKGGVYNVTTGLFEQFGQRRVFNSPLDETSILGTAIGMAQNGFIPIPEIQFLAYVHNAEDQIRGEAATQSFFSAGQLANPMVIRIAGLAYQKGFGGHFHNDNSLAVFRDLPGVLLAVPSTPSSGAKLLRRCVREAHEHGRVVIFLEPIALYMTKDLHEGGDGLWSETFPKSEDEAALDEVEVRGDGTDLAIVTYGNGFYHSCQAVKAMEERYGIRARVIDLQWLVPLPQASLLRAIEGCDHILIVDECRKSGNVNEALHAMVLASGKAPDKVDCHTADDCFIPLGAASTAGLPRKDTILRAAMNLLGLSRRRRVITGEVQHES